MTTEPNFEEIPAYIPKKNEEFMNQTQLQIIFLILGILFYDYRGMIIMIIGTLMRLEMQVLHIQPHQL